MIEASASLRSLPSFRVVVGNALPLIAGSALVVFAFVLALRRFAGAFTVPLDATTLLFTGVGFLLLTLAARSRYSATASVVLVLLVALLTSATNALGAALLLWAFVIAEEAWAWKPYWRNASGTLRRLLPETRPSANSTPSAPDTFAKDLAPPDDVLQNLVLRRADDGSQELSGWLRMDIAAGQRTGCMHIAFCPPFAELPELEYEQDSGPSCRITTAQLLHCGVRLDVKLEAVPTSEESIVVRFFAHGPG
jgi:hypothetical protein